MIRAIIFDCFGVLYLHPSQHFYETHVPNYETLKSELNSLGEQVDYGFISQQELHSAVADLTGLTLSFVKNHVMETHQRNQSLLNYSQTLRQKYRLGMLSNIGVGMMDSFFSEAERARFFDATVLSGDVGIIKPHPRIYELMAERLDTPVGECVMIDDIEENCAGADAAGMKAIHYTSNEQLYRDLEKLLAT